MATSTRFKHLQKAPDSERFYGSYMWKTTRSKYRSIYPYCEECESKGIKTIAALVDHKVERLELVAMGLSPFDFNFLRSLCFGCHQRKLAMRRWGSKEHE